MKALAYQRRQRGTALLVGMMILLVITIMTIFAVNVGVFEQRASGNEMRYKQAFHAAEAGIGSATEFIKLVQSEILSAETDGWFNTGSRRWVPCPATPGATDPCAFAKEDLDDMPGPLYKYERAGSNDLTDDPNYSAFFTLANVGTDVSVQALICIYDTVNDQCLSQVNLEDTTDFAIQLIATGTSDGGIGQAIVSNVVAPYPLITAEVAAPILANTFIGSGSFDVVANPNGGGAGIPVSVWTPGVAHQSSGATKTCNQEEFYSTGAPSPYQSTTICTNCSCPALPGSGSTDDAEFLPLSYRSGSTNTNGGDIVENDPDFPDDIFEYVFARSRDRWEDVKSNATFQETSCTEVNSRGAAANGFWWIEGSCTLGDQVGTPNDPIFLVSACGHIRFSGSHEFYGLVVAIDLRSEGVACSGVTAEARLPSGSQLYGALVTDSEMKSNGNSAVIYNDDVLNNLSVSDRAWGPIPGSWQDMIQ